MVKDSHPQAATYASTQVLPQWIQAFQQLLDVDLASSKRWDNLFYLNEIFQALSTTLISFPKTLNEYLQQLLLSSVRVLTVLTTAFRARYLNDNLDCEFALETEDGASMTLPAIASNIFLFIASGARRASAKAAFVDESGQQPSELFTQLIYLAFFYSRITTEDEETWSTDVNAFVADEDEEIPAATVRTASLDLVNAFAVSHKQITLSTLPTAIGRSLQEVETIRSEGQEDWWKPVESCLVQLASLAEELEETYFASASQTPDFSLEVVFQRLVVSYLDRAGSSCNAREIETAPTDELLADVPFLQGRAMVFASRFAKRLPEHVQQQFFQAALSAFESPESGLVTKISALRALRKYVLHEPVRIWTDRYAVTAEKFQTHQPLPRWVRRSHGICCLWSRKRTRRH